MTIALNSEPTNCEKLKVPKREISPRKMKKSISSGPETGFPASSHSRRRRHSLPGAAHPGASVDVGGEGGGEDLHWHRHCTHCCTQAP